MGDAFYELHWTRIARCLDFIEPGQAIHVPQGSIHHRRIIISRSLGPTARKIHRQKTGLSPI